MSDSEVNSSFSLKHKYLQLAWDSTSLTALKRCPRLYKYTIIDGYASKKENVHFKFGIEFHSALELYDRLKAKGIEHEDALLEAVRYAFIHTWDFKLKRPWTSDEPTKTRETLLQSIIAYLDKFGANDALETVIFANGEPAVEKSFRFEIGIKSRLTGEDYILCGHIDRLPRFNGSLYITDRKTTKSPINDDYFDKYSPDCQVSVYYTAGQVIYNEPIAGFIIDAVQLLVSGSRYQRGIIYRTDKQLKEFLKDLTYWIHQAELYAEAEYWPQNDTACGMYGGCPFRRVCGSSPEVREPLLRGLYDRRIWDPLQTREAA